jgi:hypothetical protein
VSTPLFKRVNECVTRLRDAFHLAPGYTDPRYLDGETPDSVCSLNPEIAPNEAIREHSPQKEIDFSQYVDKPPTKKEATPVGPRSWATMRGYDVAKREWHDSAIHRRCYFDAGTLPCGLEEPVVADLKKGDRVEVMSGAVRASGGSDIRRSQVPAMDRLGGS